MKTSRLQKIVKRTSPTRMFVVSFVILIFIGTVLLTLPISAKSGRFTNPVDALFTATSATCVTGLSVYDTFIHWSYFGQGVLLVLIQCGGLGLAAFATGLTLLVRRRIGIRHLVLARESAGGSNLDVISLLRIVVAFTFAVEALGARLKNFLFKCKSAKRQVSRADENFYTRLSTILLGISTGVQQHLHTAVHSCG